MSTAILTEEAVLQALRQVKYPGFSRDIVSFGFVKELTIGGGNVAFRVALTSDAPKVAEEIKAQAQTDAQARLQRAQEEVEREREKAKEHVKQQIVSLSIRTAEKILRTKLDDPAQRKLAGEFIDEVGALR